MGCAQISSEFLEQGQIFSEFVRADFLDAVLFSVIFVIFREDDRGCPYHDDVRVLNTDDAA